MRRRGAPEAGSGFALPIRSPIGRLLWAQEELVGATSDQDNAPTARAKGRQPSSTMACKLALRERRPVSPTSILASRAASQLSPLGATRLGSRSSSRLFSLIGAGIVPRPPLSVISRSSCRIYQVERDRPENIACLAQKPRRFVFTACGCATNVDRKRISVEQTLQQIADAVISMPAEYAPTFDCSC
jgi:hypothetical protein